MHGAVRHPFHQQREQMRGWRAGSGDCGGCGGAAAHDSSAHPGDSPYSEAVIPNLLKLARTNAETSAIAAKRQSRDASGVHLESCGVRLVWLESFHAIPLCYNDTVGRAETRAKSAAKSENIATLLIMVCLRARLR